MKKHNPLLKTIILGMLLVLVMVTVSEAATVLNLETVRSKALSFNRTYLSSLQDVEKAQSDITTARSAALPDLSFNASYNRNIKLPSFFANIGGNTMEFKTGFKNSFGAGLTLKQSIWKGGKVFTALKISKLYKKYAESGSNTIRAEVVNNAEVLYFAAILAQSNLDVIEKAYEANTKNLEVVDKLYSQGVVSKFEVLRAKVEKANTQPQLINAESELKLSKKRLKSFLGLDLNEEILLEDLNDNTAADLPPYDDLLNSALKNRPEMKQAGYYRDIAKKAISVARAEYFPSLEAISNYSWSSESDKFTLRDNNVRAWSAGVQLTLPIFNGGSTHGQVKNYQTEYNKANLAYRETEDQIKLQVEEAYDRYIQAKKTLEIQKETIDEAEEGLRIANLRYESGAGIQLEVISAQAALTAARNAKAQALFSLRKAKSDLKKITTLEINI